MSGLLEHRRMSRAEIRYLRKQLAEVRRAKRFPPADPTIVVRPWTEEEYYSAGHGRGRNLFFDESDEEVDTRLPSERMGYRY